MTLETSELNLVMGRLPVGDKIVDFTRQEAAILMMLREAPEGCTMAEFSDTIWRGQAPRHLKTLSVHLFNMRKKLKDTGAQVVYTPATTRYRLLQEAAS